MLLVNLRYGQTKETDAWHQSDKMFVHTTVFPLVSPQESDVACCEDKPFSRQIAQRSRRIGQTLGRRTLAVL